jgi:N6-L-threonylcarbamoyladenine synthase
MSLILGIESSCDETAAAVVRDGKKVLSSEIASQIAAHAPHGGVVPELAAREHLKALNPVVSAALANAGVAPEELDAVAVTQGPGLIPALLVGLSYAKGFAAGYNKPLIGVNHVLGHIYGAFLASDENLAQNPDTYPLLALVVSGGHTFLLLVDSDGTARQLGCTLDDAAGEALDKGAKLLSLGYPGGPAIQKAAENGDCGRFNFPRPLTGGAGKALAPHLRYSFSFSGIKTALLYHVKKYADENGIIQDPAIIRDTAAGYQQAVVEVLVKKAISAAKDFNVHTMVLAGGVACNKQLRELMSAKIPRKIRLLAAPPRFCTDNAAMIAGIAHYHFIHGENTPLDCDAFARLPEIVKVPFTDL